MMCGRMPCRASSQAIVNPTGPAPTTRTCAILSLFICLFSRSGARIYLSPDELFNAITFSNGSETKRRVDGAVRLMSMSSAKTIDQTFELAKERHLAGDLSAARELYDRVLAEQPGNAALLYRIGLLEMQQGRYVEAAGWVERAIGLTPEDSRFYL